ncbi:MAG: PQQ-binding-like beta-propeller repeat protein [Vicinamibacterales bacterium]|nr:PQQ-binding-like beta-propeller repeat protein [Vicinamibacterales bacterium]
MQMSAMETRRDISGGRAWTWRAAAVRWGLRAALVTAAALPLAGQAGDPIARGTLDGQWPTYGGDLASRRYSPLAEVDASNFNRLEIAWRFRTENLGPTPEFAFQATPLMVDGTLYLTAGSRRAAVALDAATGEMKWMHRLDEGPRGQAAPRRLSGRGLAYWAGGGESRILYVTPGYQLVALDTATGHRIPTFGAGGIVDLKREMDQDIDPITGDIGLHSAPIVVGNTIIIGAAHAEGGTPPSKTNIKGYVRGYDVRTGRRLWIFKTVPGPGEFGHETWEDGSWEYTGNTGVWVQMTVDEELGLVYLPVEVPTGDYYGGHRPGNNLFSESLVAVDIHTGERRWHYQLVHHGIWDHDIPCAPILADLRIDGRVVKAVAQATKQGWVYVFDRATGEPVWPIEERPVERGDVPGEWYSPTQPFVTKPPAFDRQGVSIDDLIDFTPALRAEAVALVERFKLGPLFTPPVVSQWEGPRATLMLPNITGGANWQGGSLDPETNYFYIFSNTNISAVALVPGERTKSDMRHVRGFAGDPADTSGRPSFPQLNVQGLPLVKPPYGRITALDLNAGTLAWQIAHGETPDAVRNHPALKGLTIPRTGRQGRIGVLTTKTLVIAGEGGMNETPQGRGAMLRAYEKATGVEVGAVYMPAPQTGSPMTYALDGRQYITVSVSGPGVPGELIAYRLAATKAEP